jgi:hypothetical protein
MNIMRKTLAIYTAAISLLALLCVPEVGAAQRLPKVIVIRPDASELECLAANEVRRYVYLRTSRVMQVKKGATGGDQIAVTCKSREFCGELGQELEPQQFRLKTVVADRGKTWWVVGGDEVGTLYGAYRLAEKLGVRFGLDEDVVPDEPLTGDWSEVNETGKPRFALRGLQPFHDFTVGPDWWNLQDYQSVLLQMAKLRLNFIGFHTYPSWNTAAGPEANVWIGLPEELDAQGNVKAGYEAGVVTTRRGWMVNRFPTSHYASGAGLLFEGDDYGSDFMLDCLDWPKTEEACAAMFNRYGDLQHNAFAQARRLGIKTCVGTELPLGVPTMVASRLQAQGLKPDDPAVIRRLYAGTFLRLMRKSPVDYYWLWTAESWLGGAGRAGWEITSKANVERDMLLAEAAAKSVQAPFKLATCGWLLGNRNEPLWMDQHAPKSWPVSSINLEVGRAPVEKQYGEMAHRPKWVIGWAEDDDTPGAHGCVCLDLQLWVERMFANSLDAYRYGCEGMMAIHWRTAAMTPNIMALAQAGWDFEGPAPDRPGALPESGSTGASNAAAQARTSRMPALDTYWTDWGRGMFGGAAGAEAGRIMRQFDGRHLAINSLVNAAAPPASERISEVFAPLQAMESLRPRIKGAGNLERYDYWLNLIRASELRVRIWNLADRLSAKIAEAQAMVEADQQRRFVRDQVLPARLAVSRSYEEMVAAFVSCAKSTGEVGAIALLEYGVRGPQVTAHDAAIQKLLGEPLPAEAALSTAYRGAPRIYVSAKRTQVKVGEAQEVRACVLSASKCTGVKLHWRALGAGKFKPVLGAHKGRQTYSVKLPAQSSGTVEYYLEAVLEDGQKIVWPATAPALNQTVIAW